MDKESEALYQRGFNEGYIIAKYNPDLAEMLKVINNDTPRLDGFRDGLDQFVIEKSREIDTPPWLETIPEPENKTIDDRADDIDLEPDK